MLIILFLLFLFCCYYYFCHYYFCYYFCNYYFVVIIIIFVIIIFIISIFVVIIFVIIFVVVIIIFVIIIFVVIIFVDIFILVVIFIFTTTVCYFNFSIIDFVVGKMFFCLSFIIQFFLNCQCFSQVMLSPFSCIIIPVTQTHYRFKIACFNVRKQLFDFEIVSQISSY